MNYRPFNIRNGLICGFKYQSEVVYHVVSNIYRNPESETVSFNPCLIN